MSQMNSENIMDDLTKCDYCKRIYNYYDFQSHSEYCFRIPPPDPKPEKTEPSISKIKAYRDNINILKPNTQRSLSASFNMFYISSTMNTNPYFNDNNILAELMHSIPPTMVQATDQLAEQINGIGIDIDSKSISGSGISRMELYKYTQQIQIAIPFECPICLNTHNTGTEYLAVKCGHIFCLECSVKWFECKSLCPLCKCDIRY